MEGATPNEPCAKGHALATMSMLSPLFPLKRYAHAIQVVLASLWASPYFESWQGFELHL